jgi:hypothetical protein
MTNSLTPIIATAAASAEFHLYAADADGHLESGSDSLKPLVVPQGVSSLTGETSNALALSPPSSNSTDDTLRLEPLFSRPLEPRLLLANPPRFRAIVNGMPSPRLALLSEGDRFHFATGPAFRVALFHRPRLGPAPVEVIGVACPVCTLPLTEADRCYVCSACGAPFHAAPHETREGALACAKMISHCSSCQQPIRLVPGYGERSQPDHE